MPLQNVTVYDASRCPEARVLHAVGASWRPDTRVSHAFDAFVLSETYVLESFGASGLPETCVAEVFGAPRWLFRKYCKDIVFSCGIRLVRSQFAAYFLDVFACSLFGYVPKTPDFHACFAHFVCNANSVFSRTLFYSSSCEHHAFSLIFPAARLRFDARSFGVCTR